MLVPQTKDPFDVETGWEGQQWGNKGGHASRAAHTPLKGVSRSQAPMSQLLTGTTEAGWVVTERCNLSTAAFVVKGRPRASLGFFEGKSEHTRRTQTRLSRRALLGGDRALQSRHRYLCG